MCALSGPTFYVYSDGSTTDATIPNALTTIESPFIIAGRDAGAGNTFQCYLNGLSQPVTFTYGSCVTTETGSMGLSVGAEDGWPEAQWNGDIAEILVYNTNLSDIARQQVENYLRTRYTTLPPACAIPTFNPVAGTYGAAQSVTISTTTSGATIRYTTDGSEPTETAGTVYSSPVSISAAITTLQAIAYKSGYADSNTLGVYTLQQCATPTFTPVAGTYYSTQSVTISSSTGGATIRYTTNGTTPSSTVGTVYSSAVTISATNTTLQAIAYKSGFENSAVASGIYTLQCATPAYSPAAGSYGSRNR